MLFFLLALHAYVWYTRRPACGGTLVVSSFALALLSKPQVIAFPFLLLLLDYWPLCGRLRPSRVRLGRIQIGTSAHIIVGWLVLEKIPLLILSVASAFDHHKGAKGWRRRPERFPSTAWLLRLETAVIAYVRYLGKAFWPSKLVALYPHPPASIRPGEWARRRYF